jgi:hypothetical protein
VVSHNPPGKRSQVLGGDHARAGPGHSRGQVTHGEAVPIGGGQPEAVGPQLEEDARG